MRKQINQALRSQKPDQIMSMMLLTLKEAIKRKAAHMIMDPEVVCVVVCVCVCVCVCVYIYIYIYTL